MEPHRLSGAVRRIGRVLRAGALTLGVVTFVVLAWLAAGWPVMVDRLVTEDDEPMPAKAIICVTGGLTWHNLPPDDGLQRIYTAVQLHLDKYAPVVLFSGGGTGEVSEAEVYAEIARWIGLPEGASRYDPGPASTNEHATNLLRKPELGLTRTTPLLVVTSPLHSKRVAMCFRKAGFTNFRTITRFVAASPDQRVRERRTSIFAEFQSSGKQYDDPINRIRWGLNILLTTLREAGAILVYKWKGYV
jgi:hypothetical protein